MTRTMTPTPDTVAAADTPSGLVLASKEESVKLARDYTDEYVTAHLPTIGDEPRDDLRLVVSELVTNGIRYGTEPNDKLRLVLSHNPDEIRVEVHDTRRRPPHFRPESDERMRGRGMFIIDALATWGVADRPMGKIVWAVIKW